MSGLLTLLIFLLLGSLLQTLLHLPVPASIVGMLLLLLALILRGKTPDNLQRITQTLSPLLPLFLIPVSVGIITQKQLLAEHGPALLVILALSLIPGALLSALIMRKGGKSGL
jgi:holin-like protein